MSDLELPFGQLRVGNNRTNELIATGPTGSRTTDEDAGLLAIDFFCGAGGMTRGLSDSGIRVLGGVDNELDCKLTYELNNPGSVFIHADIKLLRPEYLSEKLNIGPHVENLILTACSPCQFFSQLNTNKAKSKSTIDLLSELKRFIEFFFPGYLLIENVPRFRDHKFSPIKEFKQLLMRSGYEFSEAVLLCNELGIPQTRNRFVLVASRLGAVPSLPTKEKKPATVRTFIGDSGIFKPIEAGHRDKSVFQHTAAGLSPSNLQKIKHCHKKAACKRTSFSDSYLRMEWDKPAPTITTKFNSFSNGRFGHPEQDRAISLREGATLQTFPSDYVFYSASSSKIAKMIGNAVPPLLSKKIGSKIKSCWINSERSNHESNF